MFLSASLLTAFIAGVFALFAPCCIGFLLPSYLGTIFKERARVLLYTGIFAVGILTVFLPIGVGVGAVGSLLTRFHDVFFYLGSVMMIALGMLLIVGKIPMLHLNVPQQSGRRMGVVAVYVMGVFSGIGSSCCAPVFAGVVMLSALAGSAMGGAILAAVYVLGMVTPLFVLAWAIDRSRILERFKPLQQQIQWRVGPLRGESMVTYVIAGIIFVVFGVLVVWLTATGRVMSAVTWRDSVQVGWAVSLQRTVPWLASIPDWAWLLIFTALVCLLVFGIARSIKNNKN